MSRYIGITGFAELEDLSIAQMCVSSMRPERRFMAGVLVSAKTVWQDTPSPRRRYARVEQVGALLDGLAKIGAWPVLHYNTRSVGEQLRTELAGMVALWPIVQGIQLNVQAPNVEALHAFHEDFPKIELILQINRASTPEDARAFCTPYTGIVHHALLDLSGGRGLPMNTMLARSVASAWSSPISLGVAGGLDAASVQALEGMSVSCDAESKLRTEEDRLDPARALAYVDRATDVLR